MGELILATLLVVDDPHLLLLLLLLKVSVVVVLEIGELVEHVEGVEVDVKVGTGSGGVCGGLRCVGGRHDAVLNVDHGVEVDRVLSCLRVCNRVGVQRVQRVER